MPSEKGGFFVIGHRKGALRLCPKRAEERSEMAEEANENQAAGGEETDWQAKYEAMKSHAREWEKKAKENQGAASELEKLKEEQLSEIEKAQNRAKEAESKLSEYEADKARAEAVAKVADEAKVPTEFVSMLSGADADELAAQVKRCLEILPAYPTRSDDGGAAGTKPKKSKEDKLFESFFPNE